jgi:hypothetical protein
MTAEQRVRGDERKVAELRKRAANPKLATATRAAANSEANKIAARARA